MMSKELNEMNMKQLRKIGNSLGVKDNKKDDLIEKILEAQSQKEVKETIAAEEVLTDETKAAEVVAEVEVSDMTDEEVEDASDSVGEDASSVDNHTADGWDDVEEILGHDKWVDTEGMKLIKHGFSIGNIARLYCQDLGLKMSNKGRAKFNAHGGQIFKDKRWDEFFALIQSACK